MHPDDQDFTDLTFPANKTAEVQEITSTQHHPYWEVTTQKWTDAVDLKPGDEVLTADGTTRRITRVRNYQTTPRPAHNLTVANLHTYYVLAGTTPVLVHNSGCDLAAHEIANGHTIAQHVGKSDADLMARNIDYASTFGTLEDAQSATTRNIWKNNDAIADWLRGPKFRLTISGGISPFEGRVYRSSSDSFLQPQYTTTVLERAPSMPEGYRIVTSYPDMFPR